MTETLAHIRDRESAAKIEALTQRFVEQIHPLQVFLFGSFANGSYTDESDYDFYIVIDDDGNTGTASDQAYRSVRSVQNRPVDIVVGKNSRFEKIAAFPGSLQIEGEVVRNGILLYDKKYHQAGERITNNAMMNTHPR